MTILKKSSAKFWIVFLILLVLIITTLSVMEVRAQTDLISQLETRLEQSGVQVKSITVDNRMPFQIAIVLQSATSGDHGTDQDVWNELMTEREAALAHKFGLHLDRLTLILVNQEGFTLTSMTRSMNPRDNPLAYRPFSPNNKRMDDQATAQLIRQLLNFNGITVDQLSVTTGVGSEPDVQSVSIRLIASSLEAANRAIPDLFVSFNQDLERINQESAFSMVAIVRLWIVDENGNELFEYTYDVQLGTQTWGLAPGVTTDWFPQPAPTWFPSPTPSITPIPTVTPPGYPPPNYDLTPMPTYPPLTPYP